LNKLHERVSIEENHLHRTLVVVDNFDIHKDALLTNQNQRHNCLATEIEFK